eukprot:450815-Prorocentrum_lima.AAC.1
MDVGESTGNAGKKKRASTAAAKQMALVVNRLTQAEHDSETALFAAARIGSQFAKAQLRVVPSKRSSFSEFSDQWSALRTT